MQKTHTLAAALLFALPLAASAQYAMTTAGVTVRAGPDSTYPPVASLAPGTSVTVGGCIAAYTWCDVYVGDVRGFVYANYLTYPYQTYHVPIYAYGPALGLPVITFSVGTYWDQYYRGRPFYGRRAYWVAHPWHEPAPRFGHDWHPPVYHGNDYHGPAGHPSPHGVQEAYRAPEHGPGHPPRVAHRF